MKHSSSASRWPMLFAIVVVAACGRSGPINATPPAGGPDAASAAGGAGGGEPDAAGTATDVGGDASGGAGGSDVSPSALGGTWTGYIENFKLASGSDAITLVLTDATPSVTVRLGDGSGPAPATNFDVGYPPDLLQSPLRVQSGELFPLEGFSYVARNLRRDGQRLRLALQSREPWTDWCAHQATIADVHNPGRYACVPNLGYSIGPDGCILGNGQPIDCGRLLLCDLGGGACACDMTGCRAKVEDDVQLDLFVSGNEASGSIGGAIAPHNVHLVRRP